ncbi:unnamed protein product [Malus baccata var. baccata]
MAFSTYFRSEWNGKPFPFSKGCSFYKLEVIDGKRQIIYGRDSVEPAIKPGETVLADGWNSRGCYGVFGVVNDNVACVVVPSAAVTGDDMTGWIKRDFRQHTRNDGIFSSHSGNSVIFGVRRLQFRSTPGLKTRISWPSKLVTWASQIRIPVFVREKIARSGDFSRPSDILAFDLVQGALVAGRTRVRTFTRRLAQEFPTWQFLLVELRCHGDSASSKKSGPHSVSSTALDVLKLVRQLRLTPRVIVGHSFGGKVALSMVDQAAKPLARPVRVWVLDATPGIVHPGGDGEDHPEELISVLSTLPNEVNTCSMVSSKQDVVDALVKKGYSKDVAQWVVTNLRPTNSLGSSPSTFSWVFDLKGIAEIRKELARMGFRNLQRIHAAEEAGGVEMHVLEDAGHWVHADNPDGLFRILSSSFY